MVPTDTIGRKDRSRKGCVFRRTRAKAVMREQIKLLGLTDSKVSQPMEMIAVFSLFLGIGPTVQNVSLYPNLEACQSAAKSIWSYQPRTGQPSGYTAFCVPTNIVKEGAASK